MPKPRILLVGAGAMGSLHARVVAQSPSAELVTIVDPRQDPGESTARRFGANWRPELGDLTSIDGVIIAAATEAHVDLAMQVLDAGVPLLVEKPVAAGFAETLAVLAKSEERGVPIMCGLLERFNPAVITARTLVESPLYVTATRHSPYAPRIRTGVGWDLLVHDVDLAIGILGSSPTTVSGSLASFHPLSVSGAEDVAEVVLAFDNGGLAHISASRIGQRKIRALTIHELDKLIEIDLLRRDVTIYHHVSGQAVETQSGGYRQQTIIEIPELMTSQEPLSAQLEHFVGLIEGSIDADTERSSIIPSHRVVGDLLSQHLVSVAPFA